MARTCPTSPAAWELVTEDKRILLLDQQNVGLALLRKAIRDGAADGAAANDDNLCVIQIGHFVPVPFVAIDDGLRRRAHTLLTAVSLLVPRRLRPDVRDTRDVGNSQARLGRKVLALHHASRP